VRNLLLNWQMRSPTPFDLRHAFAGALKKTRFSKDGTLLAFGVENPRDTNNRDEAWRHRLFRRSMWYGGKILAVDASMTVSNGACFL
jgi:hypothetical protein